MHSTDVKQTSALVYWYSVSLTASQLVELSDISRHLMSNCSNYVDFIFCSLAFNKIVILTLSINLSERSL